MLPQVDIVLTRLSQSKDDINGYIGGRESYWDDFCLGMFLKGVCMRYVAYPVSCFVIIFFAMVLMIRYLFRTRMQNWMQRKQLLFHKMKHLKLLKSRLEMFLNMDPK